MNMSRQRFVFEDRQCGDSLETMWEVGIVVVVMAVVILVTVMMVVVQSLRHLISVYSVSSFASESKRLVSMTK